MPAVVRRLGRLAARVVRSAVPFVVVAAAAACPAPADTTPLIRVVPGAAGRFAALLGEPERQSAPAKVHAMRVGEELGGPNAIGRAGDWVLENDQVVFVIDRLGSGAGFAEGGGNVVDAADAHVRRDELGQVFTYFGVFPRQAVYDALTTGVEPGGAAWVEARGRELHEAGLAVTTRYTLSPGARALRIETVVANPTDAPIALPGLGDAVQWGGAEKLAPGKPVGFKGESRSGYVGGVGRFASYAIAPLDGDIDAVSGSSWTDTTQRKDVTIAPRSDVRYERVLVVGERPDTASLAAFRQRAAGSPLGELTVDLVQPAPAGGAAPVEVPADARLDARDASGGQLTLRASGSPPAFDAWLPAGRWALTYAGGGGRGGVSPITIDVGPSAPARAALAVTAPSSIAVHCVDAGGAPSPCKLTFVRSDGGPPPEFAPPHVAGPARNQATTADGEVAVALAPGAYRVVASRGPEFALAEAELVLAPLAHEELRLVLRRVVDTSGYLACDFHQHTMLSADAPVATRDRVVANAAEGVEIAVASEHNVVADFEPIVRDLKLDSVLVSIAGDELTSDASLRPWGHANAWPLPVATGDARGGAAPVRDRSAGEVWSAIRKSTPWDVVVQVNHPRSGKNGYFDLTGFDPKAGEGVPPGYDAHFDAIEVWNGRNVEARARVLGDLFALLRTGHAVTAVANTDTHGIVGQEAGYPRTYVRVADDAHLEAWNDARRADLVRGVKAARDVVLTNGPMLRVSANGVPVGGLAHGSRVTVRVHVESAPWVDVDEVRLVRAASPDVPDVKPVTMKPLPSGAQGADVTFSFRAAPKDAFVVIASGKRPLVPVLAPSPNEAEVEPWAMTGATWTDGVDKKPR
jgi:hypothetical protein